MKHGIYEVLCRYQQLRRMDQFAILTITSFLPMLPSIPILLDEIFNKFRQIRKIEFRKFLHFFI